MMINERTIYIAIVFTKIDGNSFLRMETFQLDEVDQEEFHGETHYSSLAVTSKRATSITVIFMNTTLGRDLLDPEKKNNYAFITNTAGAIGMVTDDFYFTRNINFPDEKLAPMHVGVQLNKQQEDSVKKKLSAFTDAFFETAKYLIMNNKKD